MAARGANSGWTVRDTVGVAFIFALMAGCMWALAGVDPVPGYPPYTWAAGASLVLGIIVRGMADAKVRRRLPRATVRRSVLQRVSGIDEEPPEIERPRFDAALNLLSVVIWSSMPVFALVALLRKGDLPRAAVMGMMVLGLGWSAILGARVLLLGPPLPRRPAP